MNLGQQQTCLVHANNSNNIQISFDTEYKSTPNYLKTEMKALITLHAPKIQNYRPNLDLVINKLYH